MYQFTLTLRSPSTILRCNHPVGPGTRVIVEAWHWVKEGSTLVLKFERQVGTIFKMCESPFCGESGWVAYVVGEGWTDYICVENLWLEYDSGTCTDCDHIVHSEEQCAECGLCLGCCDCPPSHLDDDDFLDYADTGEDAAFDDYHDHQALLNFRVGH